MPLKWEGCRQLAFAGLGMLQLIIIYSKLGVAKSLEPEDVRLFVEASLTLIVPALLAAVFHPRNCV